MKEDTSTGKGMLLDEREYFQHSSTGPRLDKGNRSTGSLAD